MRIDRASRRIAASPEAAYAAFVDRDAVCAWLPPEGASGTIEAFEPWVGGAFHMTLTFDRSGSGPPGKATADSDVVDARFAELVPGRRVGWRVRFVSDDPAYAGEMRMTFSFQPFDGGTCVAVAATHVPPGIDPADHAAGLASSLANLARYLREVASQT